MAENVICPICKSEAEAINVGLFDGVGFRCLDDIRRAQQRQDKAHVVTLLHHFLKSHPEVCPPQRP
jgi:hypothetical protein